MFDYFTDEKRFLTPYMRAIVDARPPRPVNEQFERIYWIKQKEIKAFYDAGNGDLMTLGTDHPSWGEYFTPFSVHRELLALSRTGIPNAAVLRMATINGARAIHLEKEIGSLEPGKRADLIIVNIESAHQWPLYNIYSQLVYATKASDVDSVMINGRLVMEDRQIGTIDAAAVRKKAREYADRIRKSLAVQ